MSRTVARARRGFRRPRYVAAALAVVLLGGIAGGLFLWRSGGIPPKRSVAAKHKPTFAVRPWSLVATLSQSVTAYASPTTTSAASTLPPAWAGQFLAMPVIATVPGWDEVRVVARPPAPATAWIPSATAVITRTPYHVVVDLETTRLLLFGQSRLLMCAPAGVGAAATPTPTGHYFVGLLVHPPPADAGTFAVVTSAVVDGVTDWEQAGNAMITIAASADAPTQIGTTGARTTAGSVQLSETNEDRLRPVPLGSPVDVVAALNHRLSPQDERVCASRTGVPATPRRRREA